MYSKKVTGMNPKQHPTYKTLANRLGEYRIDLDRHIASDLTVYESTLDGISFKFTPSSDPMRTTDIKAAIEQARKPNGKPAFRQGNKKDAAHFPMDASMANTKGVGYREIWDPTLNSRDLKVQGMNAERFRLGVPELDAPFGDNFGKRANRIDVSSLHVAIHGDFFSVHVDEAGFIMRGLPGLSADVMMTPDVLSHVLVELVWKDKLRVPDWFELVVPDSQHSRLGVQINAVQSQSFNLTVSGTCGMKKRFECSTTVNLFGRHDVWGG